METRERTIENYLKDKVEGAGGICLKFPPLFFRGFPDRIILMPRACIYFVELKRKGETPTAIQQKVHKRLRALGFTVEVIDSKDAVNDFMLCL